MRAASLHAALDLVLRHLLDLQAEGDVLVHRQMRVERVALEDHRDVSVARRHVIDDPVADQEPAARDVLEPGDHPQRGRLAAARRADEDHELPVVDDEIHRVDGCRAVRVGLRDTVERNSRHACASRPRLGFLPFFAYDASPSPGVVASGAWIPSSCW